MPDIQGILNQAKMTMKKKVVGERSITVGEVVLTTLGFLLLVWFVWKLKVPKKFYLPLAASMGLVYAGEYAF